MSRISRLGLQVVALASNALAFAEIASAADWKFCGARIENPKQKTMLFFDSSGVVHEPNGLLRVWTKDLLNDEVEAAAKKVGGDQVKRVKDRIDGGYVPPYTKIEPMDASNAFALAVIEDIANTGFVNATSRVLIEIDCKESKIRMLSLWSDENGKTQSSSHATDWNYIAPETRGEVLQKLACPAKPPAPASPAIKPGG